jgi:type IV fimbrial biogenesis protein FimT
VKVQIDYMSQPQVLKNSQSGFTLLEMVITLLVLGVMVSLAMPGMTNFGVRQKFVGAVEQVYGHIQQARSEAIASSVPAYASFSVGVPATNWQYGISTTVNCDPTETDTTVADACVIVVDDGDGTVDGINGGVDADDRVLMRFTDADYANNFSVGMSISGLGGGSQFIFDPVRGTLTSGAGQIDLVSSTGLELRIIVSALGRAEICSPDPDTAVLNYRSCGP